MHARHVLAVSFLLLAAGCVGAPVDTASILDGGGARVVDEAGAPVPYAALTLTAEGVAIARLSSDAAGRFPPATGGFDRAVVSATGFAPRLLAPGDLAAPIVLARASGARDPLDATPGLQVLPPHEFPGYVLGPEALCAQRNTCGLSEPVIENAPGGVVYASSVCCVGGSPPVWVSRDSGATWQDLETPGVREAIGIEGDLAIDAVGNVYFTDILLGAMWITSWDAEGAWRHTTAVPFEPLVDRPWVRAGAEDVVYFLYNTGFATNFHVSTDGGRTFLPVPMKQFPAGLGTIAQGPELDHLWVVAGDILYESSDGGATWTDGEDVPLPEAAKSDANGFGFSVPAVDPLGRVLVAYDLEIGDGYGIYAAVREPAGEWHVHEVSPPNGTHVMPWPESGPSGGFVLAWYGVDSEAANPEEVAPDAPWHTYLAATHDAGASWQLARADELPVLEGPMQRRLLDFLQIDLDESGAAHLVYAHNRDGSNAESTSYVRTTVGLGLAQLPPGDDQANGRHPLDSYVRGALGLA